MSPVRPAMILSGLVFYVLAMSCDCEGSSGLQEAAPRVDYFHVGGSEQAPDDLGSYADTPESGEISIDFGLTDAGTINRRYLFLRNTGRNDLVLSDLTFGQGSSADFVAACSSGGVFEDCPGDGDTTLEVTAGHDLIVQVSYAPRDLGPDTGSFVLALNAVDHKSLTVNLAGEGVSPEIQVCVSDCVGDQAGAGCSAAPSICNDDVAPQDLSVVFGDADMDTRVSRDAIVRNLGDRPLQITGLMFTSGDYNQFKFETGAAGIPGVLPAGQEVTIQVIYDPGTGGAHTAYLQFISNDVNEREIKLVLNGRGLAPRACPDPLALDFGNVPTGQSLEQSFTVANCGLLDLDLTIVRLEPGSSGDFSLVANPAPAVILPGDSVQVPVRYLPQAAGSDSGGVDIFSNDPASDPATGLTGTVSLLGASIPRACDIQPFPYAVQFGHVVQGDSDTITVIVSNQGTDTCTLNSAEITANTAAGEFSLGQVPSPNTDLTSSRATASRSRSATPL